MHSAAGYGNTKAIALLIKAGAYINRPGAGGSTPLYLAVCSGKADAVALLIRAGASVNQQNVGSGSTPLHIAVSSGNAEIIHMLLDAGADLTQQNADGLAPLHMLPLVNSSADCMDIEMI